MLSKILIEMNLYPACSQSRRYSVHATLSKSRAPLKSNFLAKCVQIWEVAKIWDQSSHKIWDCVYLYCECIQLNIKIIMVTWQALNSAKSPILNIQELKIMYLTCRKNLILGLTWFAFIFQKQTKQNWKKFLFYSYATGFVKSVWLCVCVC